MLTQSLAITGVSTVAALFIASPVKAYSVSLVSNINLTGTPSANQVYQLSDDDRTGASFRTPSELSTLTNIQLGLASLTGGTENVFVDLYDNSSLNGSNVLMGNSVPFATLSQSVTLNPFSPTVVTFNPTSNISLSANTTYAFAIRTASGSSFSIQSSCLDTNCTASPGYTGLTPPPAALFTSNDAGAVWNSQFSQRVFAVNANVVPEPLTILGSMSALGFAAGFERKFRKNQDKNKKN
ncbi:MAG: PEP-CTERM sorting domain-containing protein [Snowella sp.]|nr:PEP-CTERM sorting domain-containing protein [Snowella sp.]